MARNLHELLGGYATGTLTKEERTALFEAALRDQQLFNALADEEALRELLDDPRSRRQLLEILEQAPSRKQKGWLATVLEPFHRRVNLALAGSVAVAAVAVFVFANLMREAPLETQGRSTADKTDDSVRVREKSVHPRQRPEPPQLTEPSALPPTPPTLRAAQPTRAPRPARPPSEALEAAGRGAPGDSSLGTRASKPAFSLSWTKPLAKGPARQLFYGGLELPPSPANVPSEPPRRQETTPSSRQAMETSVPAPPGLTGFQLPRDYPLIGLNLGLETRGADGTHVATDLNSPLEERSEPRLTLEANTDGYLYVGTLEAGTWHWLFPLHDGPGGGLSDASIRAGQRIALPLTINARRSEEPGEHRLLIILSRQALSEMETALALASTRKFIARDIQGWLERWSAQDKEATIFEESEGRMYFVSPGSAPAVPLLVEFEVLPR